MNTEIEKEIKTMIIEVMYTDCLTGEDLHAFVDYAGLMAMMSDWNIRIHWTMRAE